MSLPFDDERDSSRKETAPIAAVYCYLAGCLTILWGVLVWFGILAGDYDGFLNAWWALPYLAGAALTALLGTASLVRREGWKRWTILCMVVVLLPLAWAVLAG